MVTSTVTSATLLCSHLCCQVAERNRFSCVRWRCSVVQDHRQTVWKIQIYPDKNLHACRKRLCLKMPMNMSRKTWYLQLAPGVDWQSSQLVRENSHHTGRWMWTRFLVLLTGPQRGSPPPPQATCNLLRRLQPSQSITKENLGSTPSMMENNAPHVHSALTSLSP